MNDDHFKFSSSVVLLPFSAVVLLWIVFWSDATFHLHLGEYGIYPRTFTGLRGVVMSPFLHGNLSHLYNNSIPLFILLGALRYFYRDQSLAVVGYGILSSGLITWIIGRESYHIGASALIYVLVSFIFFKGIRTKYYRLVALSLLVILLYGSLIWYIFPSPQTSGELNISWEGHLAGLITGFIFSMIFKTKDYQKELKYDWEKPGFDAGDDKFLQRFDENGNFVNLPELPLDEQTTHVKIVYDFLPKQNPENSK